MSELVKLTDKTYYINSPSAVGIHLINDKECFLIDTGNSKEMGRKIKKCLSELGVKPIFIINTHSHVDHIGGNDYLIRNFNIKTYGKKEENYLTEYPIMKPAFLWGGFPPKDLTTRHLVATPSETENINDLPIDLEIIDLPGHAIKMIGLKTSDNVLFLGDAFVEERVLDKYQISFIYDVDEYLKTLDKIENIQADYYLSAHAPHFTDIKDIVEKNRNKVHEIIEKLLTYTIEPKTFEEVLQAILNSYNLQMDITQYALVGYTIRSYLSYLYNNEKLDIIVENNLLKYKNVDKSYNIC